MNTAVIIDAVRTPVAKGKPGGAYSEIHPVELHATALRALVEPTGIDPGVVDDVISGAVGQVGEQSGDTARWALLAAGFPESVPGVTVDRQCGSSQQAIHFAAQGVMAGAYDVAIASGVESMSRVPIGSQTLGKDFAGPSIAARYEGGLVPQGISAELIADRWELSRAELDDFAAESHRRAAAAWGAGRSMLRSPTSTTSVSTRASVRRPTARPSRIFVWRSTATTGSSAIPTSNGRSRRGTARQSTTVRPPC